MLRGYITNLGKYNEGELVGKWIEFPIAEEELEEVFEEIGINEEYEEFFFTDWESDLSIDVCSLGEYPNIDEVNELAEALEGEDGDVIEAIIEATGYGLAEALEMVDDAIFYKGYSMEDVAYELVNDCYNLDDFALRYFDYEAFGRDLGFDGYTEVSGGVIYC